MSDELKPCPFCGGEAMIEQTQHMGEYLYRIGCSKPGCRGRINGNAYESKTEAIAAWNTRSERTCHDLEPSFYTFGCDKCGVLVEGGDEIGVLVSPEVSENRLFNYCPNCGAKVVE